MILKCFAMLEYVFFNCITILDLGMLTLLSTIYVLFSVLVFYLEKLKFVILEDTLKIYVNSVLYI